MTGFAKYCLLPLALITLVVVAVAGSRGGLSRRPPIEVFPDMDRQARFRPQEPSDFFADGAASRLPVEGTVASEPPVRVAGRDVYSWEDHPFNTGKLPGTAEFVPVNPLPVTPELLARGRERFLIHCRPCHGAAGDGRGVMFKAGMAMAANLDGVRSVRQADGELFNTIGQGRNLMGGYAAAVSKEDRWAIVAYLRALHRSHLGILEDVPPEERPKLAETAPDGPQAP